MQLMSTSDHTTVSTAARADVWDVLWAKDDPYSVAIMEKSKMLLLHESDAEDPIRTNSYLMSFDNLELSLLDIISLQARAQVWFHVHTCKPEDEALPMSFQTQCRNLQEN